MSNVIKSDIQRINFIIKYPVEGQRASFSILKVTHFKSKPKVSEKIEDDRIKSINADWKKSSQTITKKEELLRLVKEVRSELHRSQKIKDNKERLVKHVDNKRILEDFIEEKIEDRKIVAPQAHINDFTRALLFIDRANLSLKTATRKELQKIVNKIEKNTIQRRVCSRINSLLGFIGRRERLELAEYDETPFIISESEFIMIINNIELPKGFEDQKENVKNLYYTLFYTGLRIGEAFALHATKEADFTSGKTLNILEKNKIKVNCQLLKKTKKFTSTKTGDTRMAYVIQNNYDRVLAWAKLDRAEKEKIRDLEYSVIIKKAGKATYPSNYNIKKLKAHDCRHSYASYLLNAGVSISLIAQSLGNSVLVCEKYYLGNGMNPEGLDLIDSIMNTKTKLQKVS